MAIPEAVRLRLALQGFACDRDARVGAAAPWLRFTPALSTLCIITGTVLRSPAVLWAFAIIAAIGAAGWHVFDQLFNTLVRRWVHAARLPPNPAPRRFAMAVAAAWSAAAGWLMSAGPGWAGVLSRAGLAFFPDSAAEGTIAGTVQTSKY